MLLNYGPKELNQRDDSLHFTCNSNYFERQRIALSDCSGKLIQLGENFNNNFFLGLYCFPPVHHRTTNSSRHI